MSAIKHHPNLMSAGRHGSWCSCPCGWSSGTYGTTTGAHLAFGRHLLDGTPPPTTPAPVTTGTTTTTEATP
ncbi:MAG: hypothetical protein JWO67_2227 [Streptosporangiaceae bacterium]|nr:hypothetical protein [Streptosporangiaceae bacterium]